MGSTLTLLAGAAVGTALAYAALRRGTHSRQVAAATRLREAVAGAEEAGAASVARLGSVLEALDQGIVVFDRHGPAVLSNPAAARLLSPPPTRVDLLPPALIQAVADARAGSTQSMDVEIGNPTRVLHVVLSPFEQDGSLLLVARDITQAVRLERVRSDFVTNASHELKTPAAVIRASAETLQDALPDDLEAAQRFAGQLEREASRLARIVSDLLDLSRLEAAADESDLVSLDEVVRQEAAATAEDASSAKIAVSLELRPASVGGSRRDLALMVRNLIDNAIQYTPSGGSIRISLDADDSEAELTVTDTGEGVPTRDIPRIFERFYRVDRARSRETGGTGLGLSIVKHVAENHGGVVEVESELGRGTTFTVRLPSAGPA